MVDWCPDCDIDFEWPSTELPPIEAQPAFEMNEEDTRCCEQVRQFIYDNTLSDEALETGGSFISEFLSNHHDMVWVDNSQAWPCSRLMNIPEIDDLRRWAGCEEGQSPSAPNPQYTPDFQEVWTGEPMDIAWRLLKGVLI